MQYLLSFNVPNSHGDISQNIKGNIKENLQKLYLIIVN